MGKLKKIGIWSGVTIGGFLVFVLAMGVLFYILEPTVYDDNTSNETPYIQKNNPHKLYTKQLEDLLPTIDELGLNWRLGDRVDPNVKLLEMILPKDDEKSYEIAQSLGLEESVSQKYTKLETPSSWKFWATVSLYKFSTTDEALQQWNNIIDFQNKNRAFDIYGETENCRSIQESHTFHDLHTDLCYRNNVLILIEYSTDRAIQFYDVQDDFVILPMIIKNLKN